MMYESDNCKSCQTPLTGRYCYHCGQKKIAESLTLKYLLQEMASIMTNLERGLLFTIKELYLRPGSVIRDYLGGATIRYYNPLRYIVLMAGLAALATSSVDIIGLVESSQLIPEDIMTPEVKAAQQKSIETTLRYLSLFYLVMLPLYSLASYLVFKKRQYVYAEHLAANAYLYGHLAFTSLFFMPFYLMDGGIFIVSGASTLSVLGMNAWFLKSWFQLKWPGAILKSILVVVLSYTFIIVLSGIGGAIGEIFFKD